MKLILKIAVGIGLVYLVTYNGCDNRVAGALGIRAVKIDTWIEWTDYVSLPSREFYDSYGARQISFDTDSIRGDFVGAFHENFIEGYAEKFSMEDSEKLLQEMVSLKILGVWAEGTHLHISYEAWVTLEPEEVFFQELVASYEQNINSKREELSEDTYPLYATIRSLFSELTLHGRDQEAAIELPFTFEKYKGKPNMPEL